MMKPLSATPNDVIMIGDDLEVTARLVETNLLDDCREKERLCKTSGKARYGFRAYNYTHPTHWIAVDYFYGFENPADNGYMLTAVPKSQFSKAQFMERIPEQENFKTIDLIQRYNCLPRVDN